MSFRSFFPFLEKIHISDFGFKYTENFFHQEKSYTSALHEYRLKNFSHIDGAI